MTDILAIQSLSIFAKDNRQPIVDQVTFSIPGGSIVGLVGESGSGKSTTALAVAGLMPDQFEIRSGRILLEGQDILALPSRARRRLLASRIGFIYQDALTAFNPLMRVGRQVGELLALHGVSRTDVKEKVLTLFEQVGLDEPAFVFEAYPFELSGGMRQRALIAMAMIGEPCLLIADESTTALDRRLSDQIIELLKRLNRETGTSILFISHDLSSVMRLCNSVFVMQSGNIVDSGNPIDLFRQPAHPYTKQLIAAMPEKQAETREASGPGLDVDSDVIMRVRNLYASYGSEEEDHLLQDINLDLYRGEFLGMLGESGSGKTTFARVLTGQLRPHQGTVVYRGHDLSELRGSARRRAAEGMSIIFQDPYSSLDPHLSIYKQIEEPLLISGIKDRATRRKKVFEMLDAVDLDRSLAKRKPARLSGGQRQRVAIAIAAILEPDLLIADEAVASLDLSVQAQILKLLRRLRGQLAFACLFISHDLEVVFSLCDRVAVLYEGHIVECGTVEEVYRNPKHEYTKDLMQRLRL